MSATRDPSQKSNFVYTNLYTLYQKGKSAAKNSTITPHPSGAPGLSRVIKSSRPDSSATPIQNTIRPYRPIELLAKRQERIQALPSSENAIRSLKKNLEDLNELHSRIKFMLAELEDLTRNDS